VNAPAKSQGKYTFTNNYQDGLTDLLLGMVLMALGAAPVLEHLKPLSGLWEGLLFLAVLVLYLAGVYFIKLPRAAAQMPPGQPKSRNLSTLIYAAIVFIVLGLLAGAYFALDIPLRTGRRSALFWLTPALWVVLFGISICLLAYFLDVQRFYIYAFLYAISSPIQLGLRVNRIPYTLTYSGYYLPALIILAVGSIYLVRYLRQPILAKSSQMANRK